MALAPAAGPARCCDATRVERTPTAMRPIRPAALALATTLALAVPGAAPAQDMTEAELRALVLDTIRENPEIIMEAIGLLEQRQAAAQADQAQALLATERETLERDPNAPVLGNPEGDVTVVEFFDYNCPYCRRAVPVIDAVLAADPDVRIVMREWPILGEASVFAARAALASRAQGLYPEFHAALMALDGRAEEAAVLQAAREVGLDLDRLKADMTDPSILEHFETSMRLAEALGFTGTPSFVVGEALVPGLIEAAPLEELIAETRKAAQ